MLFLQPIDRIHAIGYQVAQKQVSRDVLHGAENQDVGGDKALAIEGLLSTQLRGNVRATQTGLVRPRWLAIDREGPWLAIRHLILSLSSSKISTFWFLTRA